MKASWIFCTVLAGIATVAGMPTFAKEGRSEKSIRDSQCSTNIIDLYGFEDEGGILESVVALFPDARGNSGVNVGTDLSGKGWLSSFYPFSTRDADDCSPMYSSVR
ncbi:hypothetical protein FQN53_000333 [Emmonsiellopsis sp. PD_33]|nr:hypothetical protein FQN53_000333 [Emmonsiellopsis sp. PD_33]